MLCNKIKHCYRYLSRRRKATTKLVVLFIVLFFLQSAISVVFQSLIYVKDANAYAIKVDLEELTLKDENRIETVTEESSDDSRNDINLHLKFTNQIKESKSVAPSIGPLLTLFTTFKDVPDRWLINTRTIREWSKLDRILPVMFTELGLGTQLAQYAEAHGWTVYQAPSLRQGYPVLKNMFIHSLAHFTPHTLFIGYANSDILFTPDLHDTLIFLSQLDQNYLSKRGLLVSGKRINTLIVPNQSHDFSQHHLARLQHVMFDTEDAIDYFITTRDGYPWEQVPNFVIGKPGYDNWLVKKAVDWDLLSIDTSLTISALHQTVNATYPDKGWLSKDVCMNRDLVDDKGYFPYYMGRTSCMKYFTVYTNSTDSSGSHQIELYKRQALTRYCYPPLAIPIIGVRRYRRCAELASTKTVESEKYSIINTVNMMAKS